MAYKGIVIIYCLAAVLFTGGCKNNSNGIHYVELSKVMEQFKLKKELEGRLEKLNQGRTMILDSLELKLKILSRQIKESGNKDKSLISEFEIRRDEYFKKKQGFSAEMDSLASVYDSQIAVQVNQYIKEFGEEKKYEFILGADGSGVLMYADSSKNVTNEFVVYMDKKYSGK